MALPLSFVLFVARASPASELAGSVGLIKTEEKTVV
jgi:hypothetical protein